MTIRLMLIALIIGWLGFNLSGGHSAASQQPGGGGQNGLASALNPDGTLRPGMDGSFDVDGYRMELGPNGEPRFVSLAAPGCGNGDWDSQFKLATGTNGIVDAMAVIGNSIYVGGFFNSVGNIAANRVAKFDTTTNTWSALSQGNGNGVDNTVYSLAVIGNNLYVGGSFSSANVGGTGGTPQIVTRNVARFDTTTNTWNALSQGNGNGVGGGFATALAVMGNNLFVGGGFTTANFGGTGGTPQITANRVARFDTTTNTWSALSQGNGNGLGSSVNALAVIGNNLFVGGSFTTANQGGTGGTPQITANQVAKFDAATNTWSALSQGNGNGVTIGGYVYALAVMGSNVLVGGAFNNVNTGGTGGTPAITAYGVAKFDASTSTWSALSQGNGVGASGTVYALAVAGNNIFVGGQFTAANAFGSGGTPQITANNMAKFDTSTNSWSAFIQGNGNGANDAVQALAVVGNNLFTGGSFATVNAGGTGGTPAITVSRVAKFDLSTNVWSALAPDAGNGINGNMSALAVMGNAIYVGGNFNIVGNVVANRVAKFDTTTNTWSALSQGNGNGVDGAVTALAVMGNNLYVGGSFFTANAGGTGGTPAITARSVAKFDTTTNTWSALSQGNGNGVNSTVLALAVIGNNVIVGGYSTAANIGGTGGTPQITANRVAKFDTTTNTWSALSQGDGNGVGGFQVTAFAVMGNSLFVSGDFTTVNQGGTGGTPQITANNVARFDTSTNTWSALSQGNGNGIGTGGLVSALAVMGNNLFVGGYFFSVNQGGTGGTPQIAAYCVAKFDTTTNAWSALSQGNGNGVDSVVTALMVTGNDLYVGGGFTIANYGGSGGAPQISANRVAKFNTLTNSWSNLPGSGGGNGINGSVTGLGAKDCDVYAVGYFTFADNKLSVNIARYGGPNTQPTITPLGQMVPVGSNVQIADTSDAEDAENTLRMQISSDGITFGNSATVNGVTITLNDSNTSSPGINPNSLGQVFATVAAVCCTPSNVNFILQVKDSSDVAVTAVLQGTLVFTPEIAVSETSTGGDIADGGSFNFGATTVGTPVAKTFRVANNGTVDLTLSNLTVPSGFSIAANFGSTTITPGNSTTFQITMAAGAVGSPSGSLSFSNNDADENPFNFTINGAIVVSTLQVYDGFAYPNGNFNGQNGGSGFAGAWSNAGNAIVSTSLTPVAPSENLKTCCGSVSVAGNHQGAFRSLASTYGNTTETVYLSFVGVSNSGDYAGVSLFNGNSELVFMGRASSGVTKWTLDRSATGNFGISNVNTTVNSLLVLRIDFNAGTTTGNERLRLYVNPVLGVEPGVADVDLTNAANFIFNRIRIQAGPNTTGTSFDEFRLGSTFADVTPHASPEIAVSETGAGDIADGGSFSFGTTPFDAPVTKTFTVTNLCNADLTLSNLTVPSGFSIAADFGSATVTPGSSTTFQITMTAGAVGTPSGSLSFDTNDPDEGLFNFNISGTVTGTAPMINCPGSIATTTDQGQCTAAVTFTATATGAPSPTVTCAPASGFAFPVGTTTVSCTASNGIAPNATCSFTVTVNDNQPPTLGACPTNITNQSAGANCMAAVSFTPPTATDNCGTATVTCTPASGSDFPLGTTTVSCVAKDAANNMSAACTFTVQVVDSTAPTLGACPANITNQSAGANCMAVVNFTPPTSSDNCGTATVTCTPASGSDFPLGTTTVSCVAKDAANNTSSACTFTVQVVDTTAPTVGACPANITNQSAGANCMAVVNFTPPTATDNCGTPTVTCTPASGSSFALGTTTVSCVAKDAANNMSAACTFTVQVVDTTAPTLGACPSNITNQSAGANCMATVNFTPPTASDNCGSATVTSTPASGSNFPLGTTTVSCVARDVVNNSAACTFTVQVVDTTAPTLGTCPTNITQPPTAGACGAVVTFTNPTATDNCGTPTVTCMPASGANFPIGTTTVSCVATDAANNQSATCSFTVTVTASTPPVLSYSSPQMAIPGQSLMISPLTGPSDDGSITSIVVQNVTLNAPTPVTVTVNNTTGVVTVPSNMPTGSYSVTIRAADNCGAFTDASFTLNVACMAVTVNPPTLPNGFVGSSYNQMLSATGGTPGYTFTLDSGAFPNGLSIVGSNLAGTPTATGVFNFTIKATDSGNCFGTRAYTVAVSGTGLQFYPLAHPVRLMDTRIGATACQTPGEPIDPGISLTVPARVVCSGLTIPTNASAVTGNVTTVGPAANGFLTIYPSTATQPSAANSNYQTGQTLNNVFTVGLGASDGAFKVFSLQKTDAIVDITGYFAPPGAGGLFFHPLPAPVRLLDTRPMQTACTTPGTPLLAGTEVLQQGNALCGIPASAVALVGNAITVGPAAQGFLTLFPSNETRPLIASGNYQAGQTLNSSFNVGLSPSGNFTIYSVWQTDLVIDVLGYYSAEASDATGIGLLFSSLTSARLLDTRAMQPACFMPGAAIPATTDTSQAARGTCGIPATAKAIVGNATTVGPAAQGFLTFWPSDVTRPNAVTSNFAAGVNFNRHFTVGLGADGGFKIYALTSTHLVVDVSGIFAP